MLAHTGGIRHYDYRRFNADYLNTRHFESIDEAMQKFSADALVTKPGTKYHYSSWGYVLVGCAIEGSSNVSYDRYIQGSIVDNANLLHTGLDPVEGGVTNRARGYSKTDSGALSKTGPFNPSDRYPAGGLLSTPADLVRFADAIMSGTLLGARSREQMWSSAKLANGEKTGHGLGWKLSGDGREAFHGGTTVGATAYLFVLPSQRMAVAIATNLSLWAGDRHKLAQQLASLFADGKDGE